MAMYVFFGLKSLKANSFKPTSNETHMHVCSTKLNKHLHEVHMQVAAFVYKLFRS